MKKNIPLKTPPRTMREFIFVMDWSEKDVTQWLNGNNYSLVIQKEFSKQEIDGKALLLLTEEDVKCVLNKVEATLGDVKKLWLDTQQLKYDQKQALFERGYDPNTCVIRKHLTLPRSNGACNVDSVEYSKKYGKQNSYDGSYTANSVGENNPFYYSSLRDGSYQSSHSSEDGHFPNLKPEFAKTVIALAYLFLVTWITSFVMVIVHDRVPDMKKYPPLPDIFLDNVPYIPWAFHMCEWTVTVLLLIWTCVLIFHKHRFILLRRFFALSGTVYLLRCVTMLITSLSVPGAHLQCSPRPSTYDPDNPAIIGYTYNEVLSKASQAYVIWKNGGLSIRGVRTCGDYMFSGHSVVLTMLNFFITEYTPRDLHLLHIFTWILNMFGIFFILSGHEHYSIDVFIAFYITSRLFLYYHTLANNQALMQRDSNRTRVWFPLFSFFESSADGMVPNEFESAGEICENLWHGGRKAAVLTKGGLARVAAWRRLPEESCGRHQQEPHRRKRSKKSKQR